MIQKRQVPSISLNILLFYKKKKKFMYMHTHSRRILQKRINSIKHVDN